MLPSGQTLQRGLRGLCQSKELSDFTVVSSDGHDVAVRRLVLGLHSKVFMAMFTTDCKETRTGRCEIIDVDSRTMTLLLRFMYGTLEGKTVEGMEFDSTKKLLAAADKYDLFDLFWVSVKELAKYLDLDNAVEMLVLGDHLVSRFGSPYLRAQALKFIAENRRQFFRNGGLEELAAKKTKHFWTKYWNLFGTVATRTARASIHLVPPSSANNGWGPPLESLTAFSTQCDYVQS